MVHTLEYKEQSIVHVAIHDVFEVVFLVSCSIMKSKSLSAAV